MITVGDFIISNLNIIYFVKAKVLRDSSYILVPICSVIDDRFGKEFNGDILLSDRIITINDIINTNHIYNYKLINKAIKYLIERHRL